MASSSAVATRDRSSELTEAVESGDVSRVASLLTAGVSPDERTSSGLTLLMCAITRGQTNIAILLIEHGADVNARSDHGFTPLLFAAFFGQRDLVSLLLEKGADINARSRFETSAEMWATARGFIDLADFLREVSLGKRPVESVESGESDTKPLGLHANDASESSEERARPFDPDANDASESLTHSEKPEQQITSSKVETDFSGAALEIVVPLSQEKTKKRNSSHPPNKRVAALTVAAVFASGLCTFYAARTTGGSSNAAPIRSHAVSFLSAPAIAEQNLTQFDEFSRSFSSMLVDSAKRQTRVLPQRVVKLLSKERKQRENHRTESAYLGRKPTEHNRPSRRDLSRVAIKPPGAAAAKQRAHLSVSAGEEMEVKPAPMVVEQNTSRLNSMTSTTADAGAQTRNSSSGQSVSLPAPTSAKHKVIRWP